MHPHLYHGQHVSWWSEELACDLEQERALAELEGRDPDAAVRAYRAREYGWSYATLPLEPEK